MAGKHTTNTYACIHAQVTIHTISFVATCIYKYMLYATLLIVHIYIFWSRHLRGFSDKQEKKYYIVSGHRCSHIYEYNIENVIIFSNINYGG